MNIFDKLKKIKTIISDVDGVLTNSDLLVANDEKLWRTMNAKDGMAARLAVLNKYNLIVITGGRNEAVKQRLEGLGIHQVHLGIYDKYSLIEKIKREQNLAKEEIAYIGDDLNDLGAKNAVGLFACPKDAAPEVKNISDFISSKKGGNAAFRELIEKILRIQNNWTYKF